MAQSKQQIQSILSSAGAEPRHRFGQNFMIDQNLVRIVANAGAIEPSDTIIEVGPGTGTLTEELLARGPNVIAVEIDRDLAAALRERFADEKRFALIEGDALSGKHGLNTDLAAAIAHARTPHSPLSPDGQVIAAAREPADRSRDSSSLTSAGPEPRRRDLRPLTSSITPPPKLKLIANLPYNIASPLLIELLLAGVDLLAFTVQKEVAERLKSRASDDEYGPITVMAQMLGQVELLRTLPPQAFWPQPKIDSALVRVTRNDRLGPQARDFSRFISKLFSFRRKTLRKGLTQAGFDAEKLLPAAGIDGQSRVETVSPEKLFELFKLAASADSSAPKT